MTPGLGLIPSDVSTDVAISICAIALVSGTARGFSGFGSALIFMPLASSLAAPRLVAAVLLMIDFVAAVPLIPNAWRQADRGATAVMVSGALIGVPVGNLLSQPPRSRDHPLDHFGLRVRAVAVADLGLALSRPGSSSDFDRHRRTVRLLQRSRPDRRAADRRLLARPAGRIGNCARQYPAIFWRFRFLFRRELCVRRTCHRRRPSVFDFGRSGLWHRASGSARRLFGRASEKLFRSICYVLIAAAVVIGLPALDHLLR